jgi:nitrogenase subunit NifH
VGVAALTARRLTRLRDGSPELTLGVVGSGVRTEHDHELVLERTAELGLECLGMVPYDPAVEAAARRGVAPFDLAPDGPAVTAVRELDDDPDAEHATTTEEIARRFGADAPGGIRLLQVSKIDRPDPG